MADDTHHDLILKKLESELKQAHYYFIKGTAKDLRELLTDRQIFECILALFRNRLGLPIAEKEIVYIKEMQA